MFKFNADQHLVAKSTFTYKTTLRLPKILTVKVATLITSPRVFCVGFLLRMPEATSSLLLMLLYETTT